MIEEDRGGSLQEAVEPPLSKNDERTPWQYYGYPAIPQSMASNNDCLVLRRFGYLQARYLLLLRHDMTLLDKELEAWDSSMLQNVGGSAKGDDGIEGDGTRRRSHVIENLTKELQQYNDPVGSFQRGHAKKRSHGDYFQAFCERVNSQRIDGRRDDLAILDEARRRENQKLTVPRGRRWNHTGDTIYGWLGHDFAGIYNLLLRLSKAVPYFCFLGGIPQASAAPTHALPPDKLEAGMENFWKHAMTLAPYAIALTGALRLLWIKCRHSRKLKHPVFSGALTTISAVVWWGVRSLEEISSNKAAILFGMFLLFWADFVADSSRLIKAKTQYMLTAAFGGIVIDLLCTALSFISTMSPAKSSGMADYVRQAINNGPFWLSVATILVYILQTYVEREANDRRLRVPHGRNDEAGSQRSA